MNRLRAFTLVELLVVISIIAILAAFLFPVFIAARTAVYQMGTGAATKQLMTAITMYQSDHDDTFPLAMYNTPTGFATWFGFQTSPGVFDPQQGFLSSYVKGKLGKDKLFDGKPYLGDETGLGYNYGVIGGNFHITGDYSKFPNCSGAATTSELADPSRTAVLATSVYYAASWNQLGDGGRYQFGFFDPPSLWNGNPNVDFRYFGSNVPDFVNHTVNPTGHAIVAFADGNVRHPGVKDLKEEWFWRRPLQP